MRTEKQMPISNNSFDAMETADISILMPTFERADILLRILKSYEAQEAELAGVELIVVDDGSSDETSTILCDFSESSELPMKHVSLEENGGPAAARNVGLKMVRGRIVLIVGDDILPSKTLVKDHLEWHAAHPRADHALLGRVTWPEELTVTPFMKWLEHEGRRYYFNYADLPLDKDVGGAYFYTCNVSVKRELIGSERFNESFRYASHEDLEFGNRLSGKGMTLYYDPSVRAYHWHMLELGRLARRVYVIGYSAPVYWSIVVDSSSSMRKICRSMLKVLLCTPLLLLIWRLARTASSDEKGPFEWNCLLNASYWLGLKDGEKSRALRELR